MRCFNISIVDNDSRLISKIIPHANISSPLLIVNKLKCKIIYKNNAMINSGICF